MKRNLTWLYKAMRDLISLFLIGVLIYGGVSFYGVLNGIRSDIQFATSTANENMSLTLDAFKLSLKEMNNELSSLKDLSGLKKLELSKSRLEYAHQILDAIQETGAVIGTDGLIGSEIDEPIPAQKWAASARDEARVVAFKSRDNNEVIYALATTITKQDWLIQFEGSDPISLYKWLNEQKFSAADGITNKGTGNSKDTPVL